MAEFNKMIRGRGAAVIEARGKSSAMSAANAALVHISDWHRGTKAGELVSCSLLTEKDNFYGIPEGIFFSFPCTCQEGNWKIENIKIASVHSEDIKKTVDELLEERSMALGI